jgi:hypothetical protein
MRKWGDFVFVVFLGTTLSRFGGFRANRLKHLAGTTFDQLTLQVLQVAELNNVRAGKRDYVNRLIVFFFGFLCSFLSSSLSASFNT